MLTNFNFFINHIFFKLLFASTPFARFLDNGYYSLLSPQPTLYMVINPSIEER